MVMNARLLFFVALLLTLFVIGNAEIVLEGVSGILRDALPPSPVYYVSQDEMIVFLSFSELMPIVRSNVSVYDLRFAVYLDGV